MVVKRREYAYEMLRNRGAAVVVRRRRREKRLRVLGNRGFFLGFSELSLLGFNDHGTLAVVDGDLGWGLRAFRVW